MKDHDISLILDTHVGQRISSLEPQTHFVNISGGKYYLSIFTGVDGQSEVQEEFESWKRALAELGIDERAADEIRSYIGKGHFWHTHLLVIETSKLIQLLQPALLRV